MSHKKKNRHLNELPAYTGEFTNPTSVHYVNYSDKGVVERSLKQHEEVRIRPEEGGISWIRVNGMNDSGLIIKLVTQAGLTVRDAKNILTAENRISVEEYDKNLLIIMPVTYQRDGQTATEQIAFIMGNNYVISIHESDYHLFDNIRKAIHKSNYFKFNSRKVDFLLASLINEVINYYGDYILQIEDRLEDLEDELLEIKKMRSDLITDIQAQRREVIRLRKLLLPFKGQLANLLRIDSGLIHPQEMPYFKDINDQLNYILQNIESCREILSSLVDLYLDNNDVQMNMVMKQLTIVATIFIPLTFLVGVWGMNFSFMPELDWRYGYAAAWALMLAIGIGVWLYLRRKDRE